MLYPAKKASFPWSILECVSCLARRVSFRSRPAVIGNIWIDETSAPASCGSIEIVGEPCDKHHPKQGFSISSYRKVCEVWLAHGFLAMVVEVAQRTFDNLMFWSLTRCLCFSQKISPLQLWGARLCQVWASTLQRASAFFLKKIQRFKAWHLFMTPRMLNTCCPWPVTRSP